MGKIVGYATVGMVLALAKKMAIQYGALGISDVRTTPDGSDLIFIMSDGSQHRVELNFSANGVDYDDSVTRFNVSNVQAAIEALFSELQAKQNISNKVTSISSLSTDDEYPSAKCVYDIVGDIETLLGGI